MNRRTLSILILGILLLTISGSAVWAQDVSKLKYPKLHEMEIPQIEKVTLDNGMRLYIVEDRDLPIFRVAARINCGSYLEPADKVGLADFCGAVMRTGGTQKWTGDEIDELLESVGGSVETSLGSTSGNASIRVLSDYTDLGLEVLAQVLRHPVFEQDKLDLAKVQERSSIARRNDEPFQVVLREFRKAIYGPQSPYARHTEYATIDAITRDDLVSFHDRYIHPQNIQMAVWGDFDKGAIVEKIKQYFGDWQRAGAEVPAPPKVDYTYESKIYYAEKESPQAYILIGHVGGYLTDPDYADRIVMNSILGAVGDSRLFNNVRSKEGLVYTPQGSYTASIERPGIFYLYGSTKPETVSKAIKEMIKQAASMQTDPPTDTEMKKSKDGYLNSFVFQFDDKAEVINRMMTYDFYGLPEDLIFQVKEGVESVTKDDVVTAARNNLHPDKVRIVVVGEEKDFDMPLSELGLGPVEQIDISIPSGEVKKELAITPENLARGKELFDQAVTAAGGIDNFKSVKSVSLKGTFVLSMQGQEIPLGLESIDLYPDKSRTVMNVMGNLTYDIQNGDQGWQTVNPMTGEIKEMTAEDIADVRMKNRRDVMRLFRQADNLPYRAVYDGAGEIEGSPVEFIVIVDDNDEPICRFGIAEDTHLITSKSYWGEAPMRGEGMIEEHYFDYQDTQGVKIAMRRVQSINGEKFGEMNFEAYTLNEEIPADAFTKPE